MNYCKDCKYVDALWTTLEESRKANQFKKIDKEATQLIQCNHPDAARVADYVAGYSEQRTCWEMRHNKACGAEGLLFEEK